MRLLPYGPSAVLAEFNSLDDVMRHARHWRSLHAVGIVDVVPAARTVLVTFDGHLDPSVLTSAPDGNGLSLDAPAVEIGVDYNGVDLVAVAEAVGVSVDELVDIHTSAPHVVAFCGFMPGFAYITGLPERLHLARRATPRERVPAGSVAIAAGFTGIYPRMSPGGWHILGSTDVDLWDDNREPPALLTPGARVRFVAR